MADFNDFDPVVQLAEASATAFAVGDPEASSAAFGGAELSAAPAPGEQPSVTYYRQRIWDQGASQWVYYVATSVTSAPAPGDTTPNHSGTLKAASHEVLSTRKV